MRHRHPRAVAALALASVVSLAGCGTDASSADAMASASVSTTASTSAGAAASPTASATTDTRPSSSATASIALPTEQPEGYAAHLTTAAGTSFVTVAVVEGLPQVTIDTPNAGMPQQSGTPLREVIAAGGATAFETVTITGPGGSTTLPGASIDDTVILGVTKRQTLRFSGEALETAQWVQDVTSIEVS